VTWGQYRFQLQTGAPDVSVDLLDGWLNARYEQVLEATNWLDTQIEDPLTTVEAYSSTTDTITTTAGQPIVTGVGTAWTREVQEGRRIYRPGDSMFYTITEVLDPTHLVLDRPYNAHGTDPPGTVYPGLPYVIFQHLYKLPDDLRMIVSVLDPRNNLPLEYFNKTRLDDVAGKRTTIGEPGAYARAESIRWQGMTVSQIEFYPPPAHARTYTLVYLRAAIGFDGESTDTSPLPFVSSTVLLTGVRSDIATYMAGQHPEKAGAYLNQAKAYAIEYGIELAKIVRQEHQERRRPARIRMADRFTRHRLARSDRNRNNFWSRQ